MSGSLDAQVSPCLAGCVRLFGCLSSLVSLGLSRGLAGGVRVFWCLPPLVSLYLFPSLAGGVRLFECLSSRVSLDLSLSLAGGARLSDIFQIIRRPVCLCAGGAWLSGLFPFMRFWISLPAELTAFAWNSLDVSLDMAPLICPRMSLLSLGVCLRAGLS